MSDLRRTPTAYWFSSVVTYVIVCSLLVPLFVFKGSAWLNTPGRLVLVALGTPPVHFFGSPRSPLELLLTIAAVIVGSATIYWPLLFSRSSLIASLASLLDWVPALICLFRRDCGYLGNNGVSVYSLVTVTWLATLLLWQARNVFREETWRSGLVMGLIPVGMVGVLRMGGIFTVFILELVTLAAPVISVTSLMWFLIRERWPRDQGRVFPR